MGRKNLTRIIIGLFILTIVLLFGYTNMITVLASSSSYAIKVTASTSNDPYARRHWLNANNNKMDLGVVAGTASWEGALSLSPGDVIQYWVDPPCNYATWDSKMYVNGNLVASGPTCEGGGPIVLSYTIPAPQLTSTPTLTPTPTTSPNPQVLFSEDFENYNSQNWVISSGSWNIEVDTQKDGTTGKVISGGQTPSVTNIIYTKGTFPTGISACADARLVNTNPYWHRGIGLEWGTGPSYRAFYFQYRGDTNELMLDKINFGTWDTILRLQSTSNSQKTSWDRICLEANGANLRAILNNQEIFNIQDNDLFSTTAYRVALQAGSSHSSFDNVVVTSLLPTSPAPTTPVPTTPTPIITTPSPTPTSTPTPTTPVPTTPSPTITTPPTPTPAQTPTPIFTPSPTITSITYPKPVGAEQQSPNPIVKPSEVVAKPNDELMSKNSANRANIYANLVDQWQDPIQGKMLKNWIVQPFLNEIFMDSISAFIPSNTYTDFISSVNDLKEKVDDARKGSTFWNSFFGTPTEEEQKRLVAMQDDYYFNLEVPYYELQTKEIPLHSALQKMKSLTKDESETWKSCFFIFCSSNPEKAKNILKNEKENINDLKKIRNWSIEMEKSAKTDEYKTLLKLTKDFLSQEIDYLQSTD